MNTVTKEQYKRKMVDQFLRSRATIESIMIQLGEADMHLCLAWGDHLKHMSPLGKDAVHAINDAWRTLGSAAHSLQKAWEHAHSTNDPDFVED